MSLRLTTTTSTFGTNPLQTFELDVNIGAPTKCEVFKFLAVILKNLTDPIKAQDVKYRTLKFTTNPKIQKMTAFPAVLRFLQTTVGFAPEMVENDELVLRIPQRGLSSSDDLTAWRSIHNTVLAAHERVSALLPKTISNSSSTTSLDSLTEKQKARKLREEHELTEKQKAREARKQTQELIQSDKHVRENDPNWKPAVAAAAAKSGDAKMNSFRDTFGE